MCKAIYVSEHNQLINVYYMYLHDPEKFIGCVIASYLSMLKATNTYVDAYMTHACKNRMNLQAIFPARHDTVIRQIMSVRTLSNPTERSVAKNRITIN